MCGVLACVRACERACVRVCVVVCMCVFLFVCVVFVCVCQKHLGLVVGVGLVYGILLSSLCLVVG